MAGRTAPGSDTGSGSAVGRAARNALIDERDGPLPVMLLGLTVLAGIVDATSILALNHVFVAAMTGNLVFIGLGLAGTGGFSIWAPAVSLAAFVLGVLVGARALCVAQEHRGRALRNVCGVKAVCAIPVTILAVLAGDQLSTGVRTAITVLLAVSMGSQLALIRYLKVPDLLTVVLTMTITGALTERGRGRADPAVLRRGFALLAFVIGVVSGGVLIRYVAVAAALGLGLIIIVTVGVATHLASRAREPWTAPK